MFKYPLSSALHCLVSETIIFMFHSNVEDIINMLLDNNEKFIDRIIDEYSTKGNKKGDFYPHLEQIIKSIVNNEKGNNRLQQYQKWKDFISKCWDNLNALPGKYINF